MDDQNQQHHAVMRIEVNVRRWKVRFWAKRPTSLGGRLLLEIEGLQDRASRIYHEWTVPVPNQSYRWLPPYDVFNISESLNIPDNEISRKKREFQDSWHSIQQEWRSVFADRSEFIASLSPDKILNEFSLDRNFSIEAPLSELLGSLSVGPREL